MTNRIFMPAKPDVSVASRQLSELRPFGGARLIAADPCWLFKDWSDKGNKAKTAGHQYELQSLDWIQALPVGEMAAKNCVLFLWATNPMIREAIDTMDAWGFSFRTMGAWVKRSKYGKVAFGGGRIFRSSSEPILVGVKGRVKMPRDQRGVIVTYEEDEEDHDADPLSSLGFTIEAQRREHSRKPDEFYEMCRHMVPDGPAMDLFSRQKREGWIAWGNETEKFGEAA